MVIFFTPFLLNIQETSAANDYSTISTAASCYTSSDLSKTRERGKKEQTNTDIIHLERLQFPHILLPTREIECNVERVF